MALPEKMRALKNTGPGTIAIQQVPIPTVHDDWILVKIKYVALNPTDWKHIDLLPHPGTTVGCDYSGTVISTGPNCMTTWQPGDRIAGVTQGSNKCNPSEGVFGDYALVREGVQIRIPDNVSDVDAATIGVAFATTGLVLYQQLSLPWPGSWVSAECFVLVYGGSTSTGSIAVQFAKLSGTRVVTTCSPRNFDFCKRLGAEEVFDYNDPDCASQIREYTQDKLHFVMDCFAGEPGTAICANAISSRGGQISSIIPGAEYPRKEDVRSSLMLAYKALGEPWFFTEQMPATHEDYEFSKMFCRLEEIVLREGKVKTHPTNVREGLENVEGGLDEMRRGVVSAKKLVYKIAD